MTAVFWLIVILGLGLIANAVGSDRRNPPMKKCERCDGAGVIATWGPRDKLHGPMPCGDCFGDGWVPA